MSLALEDWVNNGEPKAANYIQEWYGTYPCNVWYYNATGKLILLLQSQAV
jgi:hypothetical protein